MNAGAPSGRMAAAVGLAVAGLGLGLLLVRGHRPTPIPAARGPIPGIAYAAELEICPDCAKTDAAGATGGAR